MRLLEGEQITALVLSGPATRESLGLVGEDPASAIDVLVSPDQLGRARAALSAQGYARRLGVHAERWSRPDDEDLDLRWTLPRVGVSPSRAFDELMAHHDWLRCASGVVPAPNAAGRLLYLALGATVDGSGRAQDDLRRALRRATPDDWAAAQGLARRLRCRQAVSWALRSVGRDDLAVAFGPAPETLAAAGGASGWALAPLTSLRRLVGRLRRVVGRGAAKHRRAR